MLLAQPRTVRQQATRIFSDDLWSKLTDEQGNIDVEALIRPALLVGINAATGGVVPASVDANGRLRTDAGILMPSAPGNTLATWNALAVGQYGYFTTGSTAGNVTATLPSIAPSFGDSIFEVHEILHTLDNDATAASRVPTLVVLAGLPSIVTTLNDWSQVGATATANQNAKLFIPRGPATAKINTNGTITDGATSPLPISGGDAMVLSVTVAAGVAGDAHSLSALVRRIA